jgi:UrcA family protein
MTLSQTAAAAVLAALLASPAAAGARRPPIPNATQEVVRYTPAEAASPEGAQRIAFRIRVAADQACGGANVLVRVGGNFHRCRHEAIDRALRELGAPLVADAMGRDRALASR